MELTGESSADPHDAGSFRGSVEKEYQLYIIVNANTREVSWLREWHGGRRGRIDEVMTRLSALPVDWTKTGATEIVRRAREIGRIVTMFILNVSTASYNMCKPYFLRCSEWGIPFHACFPSNV